MNIADRMEYCLERTKFDYALYRVSVSVTVITDPPDLENGNFSSSSPQIEDNFNASKIGIGSIPGQYC